MQAAYFAAGGDGNIGCTANDVSSSVTAITTAAEGPPDCVRGEYITVNITTSISFSSGQYYDFGVYTSLDYGDALSGNTCAHGVFGPAVAATYPRNIQDLDGDNCHDVVTGTGWTLPKYSFPPNLRIPCQGTQNVAMENCYTWRQPETNVNCNEAGYSVPAMKSVSAAAISPLFCHQWILIQ